MYDQDHYNNILSKFDDNVPNIFFERINDTNERQSKRHFSQLRGIYFFYRAFVYKLPSYYLSKSQIRVDNDSLADMYCKNPYVDGTIENLVRILERQFFDIVYMFYGGTYRPIHVVLRYMLELTSWATVSIIDKKELTGRRHDRRNAMSFIEFEKFLETNLLNIEKKKHPLTNNKEKCLKTYEGLAEIPGEYVKFFKFDNYVGMNAIKLLLSKLSKYAHANIWSQLRSDGDDYHTNIDTNGLHMSVPSSEGYHRILPLMIQTHEIIFYMLFVASYENLIYFNKDYAKKFTKDIKELVEKLQPASLQLKSLNLAVENPISKKTNVVIENKKTKTVPDPNFDPVIDEKREQVCAECKEEKICFENERCYFCHSHEIGPSRSTEEYFH